MISMKDLEQIRIDFNDAISGQYSMMERCHDDIRQAYVDGAWWDGSNYGKQFKNKPKPEMNKIWKALNRVIGSINNMELNANIVSNSDEATDEDADLLQNRWRNDFNATDGAEANEIANQEAILGGFGCTKLVAKYENEESPEPDKQYLCVEPISSACTSVVFGAGAIRKDKSDATQGWQLMRVNRKAIEEEYGTSISSYPQSVTDMDCFNWNAESTKDIYIAHYWEVVTKNLVDHEMGPLIITSGDGIKDQFGEKYTREDLKEMKEVFEMQTGEQVKTTRRKVKYVEYALLAGDQFLIKPQKTPFKRVPLFPRYGYHVSLNGIEYFCGEVRKKRDPEMFSNMFASALFQIMAADQVGKPEYAPEQIARHANQRARADVDNVPFLMSDPLKDANGSIIQAGPVGFHQPPQIGTGLASAGQYLEQSLAEHNGLGNATVPSNASGDAIQAVNERQDDVYLPMVHNIMHSIKAMCSAWIPAAQKIYFSNQRRLRVQMRDGSYDQVTTLEYKQQPTGEYGPYGNSARGMYTVQVKKGESYQSEKDAERQTNLEMLQYATVDSPMGQMLMNQAIISTTGDGGKDARKIARYNNIIIMLGMGIDPEPQNEEEEQFVQQQLQQQQAQQQAMMQQQQQQEQAMIESYQSEGQARLMEGQAAVMNEENDAVQNQIDLIGKETDRIKVLGELQIKDQNMRLGFAKDLQQMNKPLQDLQQ